MSLSSANPLNLHNLPVYFLKPLYLISCVHILLSCFTGKILKMPLCFLSIQCPSPRSYFPLNSNTWHQWLCPSLLKYFPLLAFAWIPLFLSLPNSGSSFLFYFSKAPSLLLPTNSEVSHALKSLLSIYIYLLLIDLLFRDSLNISIII